MLPKKLVFVPMTGQISFKHNFLVHYYKNQNRTTMGQGRPKERSRSILKWVGLDSWFGLWGWALQACNCGLGFWHNSAIFLSVDRRLDRRRTVVQCNSSLSLHSSIFRRPQATASLFLLSSAFCLLVLSLKFHLCIGPRRERFWEQQSDPTF